MGRKLLVIFWRKGMISGKSPQNTDTFAPTHKKKSNNLNSPYGTHFMEALLNKPYPM